MSLLSETFATTRAEGRAALVGYLPAGFPSAAEAVAVIAAMVENGVDIVEVGLPYSDPLMDGPVIQSAVDTALAGGTRIRDVFACVAATAASGAPALVMSYWNPIERYGTVRFADELAAAGGVGVITPDLTPEEAGEWIAATDAARLDRVFLVRRRPPTSASRRWRGSRRASSMRPPPWASPGCGRRCPAPPSSWWPECGPPRRCPCAWAWACPPVPRRPRSPATPMA